MSAIGGVYLVDGSKNYLPFLQRHHRRTLVFQNCLVGMDTHVKFLAESASLQHGTGMTSETIRCQQRLSMRGELGEGELTMMAEIETAVNPDSVIGDWHIFLGIDRPMPRQGN